MTRTRFVTPGVSVTTRGRSLLRYPSVYRGRATSPVDDLYYTELYRPIKYRTGYDPSGEENFIRRSVNRELILSTHELEDELDMASKSRNRDQRLLREANQAMVDAAIHGHPKSEVTVRRARSVSVAPRSSPSKTTTVTPPSSSQRAYWSEVDYLNLFLPASARDTGKYETVMADWYPWYTYYDYKYPSLYSRAYRASSPSRKPIVAEYPTGPSYLRYSYPHWHPTSYWHPASYWSPYYYENQYARKHRLRFVANPLPHKRVRKAAIVGHKVDVVTPKHKTPRSEYAANAMRRIRKEQREKVSPPAEIDTSGQTTTKTVGRRRWRIIVD